MSLVFTLLWLRSLKTFNRCTHPSIFLYGARFARTYIHSLTAVFQETSVLVAAALSSLAIALRRLGRR